MILLAIVWIAGGGSHVSHIEERLTLLFALSGSRSLEIWNSLLRTPQHSTNQLLPSGIASGFDSLVIKSG